MTVEKYRIKGDLPFYPLTELLLSQPKLEDDPTEFTVDDLVQRAQKLFHFDTTRATAVRNRLSALFRTGYREYTISRDRIINTDNERTLFVHALVAIDLAALKPLTEKTADPKTVWTTATPETMAALGRIIAFFSYLRHPESPLRQEMLDTMRAIDFTPLALPDVQQALARFPSPEDAATPFLTYFLETELNLGGSMRDALPNADHDDDRGKNLLHRILATYLRTFPAIVAAEASEPVNLLDYAMVEVQYRRDAQLGDALYGDPLNPVIADAFARHPHFALTHLETVALMGHPAALPILQALFGDDPKGTFRALWPLRKYDEHVFPILARLADPDDYLTPHPQREADLQRLKQTVQAGLFEASLRSDIQSGYVLTNFLLTGDGHDIYQKLETHWRTDGRYRGNSGEQIKTYIANVEWRLGKVHKYIAAQLRRFDTYNATVVLRDLALRGSDPALTRLKELVLQMEMAVMPYALKQLEKLHTEQRAVNQTSAFFANELPATQFRDTIIRALESSEENPRIVDINAQCEEPLRIVGNINVHQSRGISDAAAVEFPAAYAAFHTTLSALRGDMPGGTKLASEGVEIMAALARQDSFRTAGANRPVNLLATLVLTGYCAADDAWHSLESGMRYVRDAMVPAYHDAALAIAEDPRASNQYPLTATTALLQFVTTGTLDGFSNADAADLVGKVRAMDTTALALRLAIAEESQSALDALHKLTFLENVNAWRDLRGAFPQFAQACGAIFTEMLADHTSRYHADILNVALDHTATSDDPLYQPSYDLILTAAEHDRAGSWAAVGGLALREVGSEAPAVSALLDGASAQFPDELVSAHTDYDLALADLLRADIDALDPESDATIDPQLVAQAERLAGIECYESLATIEDYERRRRAREEIANARVPFNFALDAIHFSPYHVMNYVTVGPLYTDYPGGDAGSVTHAGGVMTYGMASAAGEFQPSHTTPFDFILSNPSPNATFEIALGAQLTGILNDATLEVLVTNAVLQEPGDVIAQEQLANLMDYSYHQIASGQGNANYWLSMLGKMVYFGHGEPLEALQTLQDLTAERPDLQPQIHGLLTYLNSQFDAAIDLPALGVAE